jgi:hypothetical protein
MAKIADDPHREATPEERGVSTNDGTSQGENKTAPHPTDGHGAMVDVEVPPHPRMSQLQEQQWELKTA